MGRLGPASVNIPSHSKAIISLFAVIPAASIAAAEAMSGDSTAPFYRKIPLLSWGAKQSFSGNDLGPCWIAINCGSAGSPTIEANIQTGTTATIANSTLDSPPANFRFYRPASISADGTIHVIASYDLTAGVAAHSGDYPTLPDPSNLVAQYTASASAWLAVNDANILMSTAGIWPTGGPTNKIGTFESDIIASSTGNPDLTVKTYSLSSPTVGAGPVGIPVQADYSGQNLKVYMGMIQIVTGVSLDTSVTDNRRLLIKSNGMPETSFTAFDAANGKSPEVRLSTSSKIKAGVNDGTLGNFTKAGTINIGTIVFDISP